MKKMLLLAAFAFSASAAVAQTGTSFFSTEKSSDPIAIGLRAGLNFNSLSDDADTDAKVGFRVGVEVDIPVWESLHIVPGLYFSTRPCKSESNGYYSDGEYETEFSPSYLELPVLASYRYQFNKDWAIRVDLGPYFAYGLGGKEKWTTYYEVSDEEIREESGSEKLFSGGDHMLKRFDAGIVVGVGAIYKKFTATLNYQAGLSNICKYKRTSIKNTGVYINLGYNF